MGGPCATLGWPLGGPRATQGPSDPNPKASAEGRKITSPSLCIPPHPRLMRVCEVLPWLRLSTDCWKLIVKDHPTTIFPHLEESNLFYYSSPLRQAQTSCRANISESHKNLTPTRNGILAKVFSLSSKWTRLFQWRKADTTLAKIPK